MKTAIKILIPTDFSAFSLAALDYVKSQPMMDAATLYLLHVVNDPVLVAPYPSVDLNTETILRDAVARAEQEMEQFVRKNIGEKRRVVPAVRRGEASREINAFAADEKMDLIVIATHGRTGLAHMILGSVAEKVIRYSHVPVLTIKPQDVLGAMPHQDAPRRAHEEVE